jgi:hypothetical protein
MTRRLTRPRIYYLSFTHVLDDSLPPLESMRLSIDALYFTMHHVETGAQWLRMLCRRMKQTVRGVTPDVLLATAQMVPTPVAKEGSGGRLWAAP